ncbi:MAG: type II secretion system F family protein [Ilumatobacteraceae bacterium]
MIATGRHELAAAVSVAAFIVVALLGWRLRPRSRPRASIARPAPGRWLRIMTIGAATCASPLLGLVAVIVPVSWRRWTRARCAARMTRAIATDFPDAIDLLVLSVRAGYLPAQAIGEIAPYLPQHLRTSFDAVGRAMASGERFADALHHLQAGLGPRAQPLVDSLSAADRYGLPLAPVLERLAFEARQQRRRDTDAAARELPVRLAMPLVLCTLPSFVLLAIVPLLLGALSSLHT